jgi:ubiquinone/menaquinone biosynthesis C-methylase UbiE
LSREKDKRGENPVDPGLYDEEYFLWHCGGHEVYRQSKGALLDERLGILLELVQGKEGMNILDVGCGRGELVRHLSSMGARVWGLDISSDALKISRGTLREGKTPLGACLCKGNSVRLPFASGSFDRVILSDIMEHLGPEDLARTIKEVRRVIRSSGKVVFHTFPNRWFYDLYYPLKRLLWDLPKGKGGPRNPRTRFEKLMHVQELSPLDIWRYFKTSFRVRIFCAHRSKWDREKGAFSSRWPLLALIMEPEIWGIGIPKGRK